MDEKVLAQTLQQGSSLLNYNCIQLSWVKKIIHLGGPPLVLENLSLRSWDFFLRVLHIFFVVGHIWILQPKIKEVGVFSYSYVLLQTA